MYVHIEVPVLTFVNIMADTEGLQLCVRQSESIVTCASFKNTAPEYSHVQDK